MEKSGFLSSLFSKQKNQKWKEKYETHFQGKAGNSQYRNTPATKSRWVRTPDY